MLDLIPTLCFRDQIPVGSERWIRRPVASALTELSGQSSKVAGEGHRVPDHWDRGVGPPSALTGAHAAIRHPFTAPIRKHSSIRRWDQDMSEPSSMSSEVLRRLKY